MKIFNYIVLSLLVASAWGGCSNDESIGFDIDNNSIEIDAVGGTRSIKVSSAENWVASASVPWITVTPANGYGCRECKILIDSALTAEVRTGVVRIAKTANSSEYKQIEVRQEGFDYSIVLDEPEVTIENYATIDDRYVDVSVWSNIDFDVNIPDSVASWVTADDYALTLDRGLRPRQVKIRFKWGINSKPQERLAEIEFVPKDDSGVSSDMLARNDRLKLHQNAAAEIKRGTREGDSVALLSIARTLGVWGDSWESSGEKMDNWDNVVLWEEGMDGYVDSLKGRVKSAQFYMFATKEGLPYEVQYLTGAEELEFYSNVNTFQLNLSTGEYICKLEQLKRLTIGAYGLTELHEDFKNLRNLEYLDLGSNNFQSVPEMINPENFPKLHVLRMANNQRKLIYDLSNNIATNFGGLYDETAYNGERFGQFPERLFKWTADEANGVVGLDTLVLSVNYLQGSIPSFEDDNTIGYYTEQDIINSADTLPRKMLTVKRVMPQLKMLTLNLNRLTGELPEWLLYHPSLDWWDPGTLIFTQEGKDELGNLAGFSNMPANLNYYYEVYTKKKLASDGGDDDADTDTDASGR